MKPYADRRTKREQVEAMFDRIAPFYDLLNDIMSIGIARRWRRAVVREVAAAGLGRETTSSLSGGRTSVLDLATGTGDLAVALARRVEGVQVTGADISESMLARARLKASSAIRERGERNGNHTCVFVRAEAEKLPFAEGGFDAVTAAFGVRNFGDIPKGLAEMHRVLRTGGGVFILEFSTPRGRVFGALYRFYFHRVLPRIGGLVSRDRRAYTYLPGSVAGFPAPHVFVETMRAAGFAECSARPLTGGVAYIYKGKKL